MRLAARRRRTGAGCKKRFTQHQLDPRQGHPVEEGNPALVRLHHSRRVVLLDMGERDRPRRTVLVLAAEDQDTVRASAT